MTAKLTLSNPKDIAAQIDSEIKNLSPRNTPNVRAIRRKYSDLIKQADPQYVLDLAYQLIFKYGYRGAAYELIVNHKSTYRGLDEAQIGVLGQGIDSWWSVDSFARIISGPAWHDDLISDAPIHKWARSKDRWWRRAALVSTVAFNVKTHGGTGDTKRTLSVCRLLIDDRDDMVVKAMSWALRELVPWDPDAVQGFLTDFDDHLASQVKREVNNKLKTGLKNPRLTR